MGRTIIFLEMETNDEEGLGRWYEEEHWEMMAKGEGYLRGMRYKRSDGVEPRFLSIHEYDCEAEGLPRERIDEAKGTEWSRKIFEGMIRSQLAKPLRGS